jgi:hypothetical protein
MAVVCSWSGGPTFALRHIRTILDKTETADKRDWYAAAAIQHGWSRNVLMNRSMERTGAATSNFVRQLATADSELA